MDELVVVFMGRIEDGFKELLVAICAANILWWASTITAKANGMIRCALDRQNLLQYDLMPPVIAEIVDVDHCIALQLQCLVEWRSALVDDVEFSELVIPWIAPDLAVLLELMKMAVGLADCNLKCVMKAA
jgi:hypothetical protein